MFVANHALTEASASGPTVSDARRRGPVLLAVTMAAIRNGAAPGRAFVRYLGFWAACDRFARRGLLARQLELAAFGQHMP
jgi:hypothetical protein